MFLLDKPAADGAHVAVVDVEGIALARRDRAGEGAAEDNLPGFELDIVRRQLVGQPGHAVGRMIEYARGDAGLFNYAVAIQQGGDPAQVELVRFNRPAPRITPALAALSEMVSNTLRGRWVSGSML